MKEQYKVIIIGAGPAGLSCGLNLLKEGIKDILVVEKFEFPRYKCCAGYITNKTKEEYEALGLDIEKANYSLIRDFNIIYKKDVKQTITNKFLYTNKNIDRVELDYNFYKLAKDKNIEIQEKQAIKDIDVNENEITLTNGEKVKYENLVFADGTLGFGSRFQKLGAKNIAMQMVIKQDLGEKIDIHFGVTKRGYGWISSKDGVVNAGLTDVYDSKVDYEKMFENYLRDNDIKFSADDLKGAFTPIGVRNAVLNDNVFFVGDALGACDPLTLSGLRYGLKSGQVCAKAIKENDNKIFQKYARNLRVKFSFMTLMLRVFYLKPVLFLTFNVATKYFGGFVAGVFNNFFVNKK